MPLVFFPHVAQFQQTGGYCKTFNCRLHLSKILKRVKHEHQIHVVEIQSHW